MEYPIIQKISIIYQSDFECDRNSRHSSNPPRSNSVSMERHARKSCFNPKLWFNLSFTKTCFFCCSPALRGLAVVGSSNTSTQGREDISKQFFLKS